MNIGNAAISNETVDVPESSSSPSSKNDGFESKFSLLGKMVFDVANTNLLPSDNELQSGFIEGTEGQSIVEKFLVHICPIFEEEIVAKIEKMGKWQSINLARIGHIASMRLLAALSQMHLAVHPRVMSTVIEKGSLTEDPALIEMWANLLVSASTFDQDDERYISYAYFLENISPGQASILCRLGKKSVTSDCLGTYKNQDSTTIQLTELLELVETEELSELKLDLTFLESLRLIDMDWQDDLEQVTLNMTSLGIQFYKNTQIEQANS